MNCFDKKPKKGYGFIYKYTSPSGKSYIGQTIRSLHERAIDGFGKGYVNCVIFYQAIRKYGFSNFIINILEECLIEKLDEREEYYILKENTLQPNGYNIRLRNGKADFNTKGRKKEVNQYDLNGNFIATYSSVKEAADANNIQYQTISAIINGKRTHDKDYTYTYKGKPPQIVVPQKTHGRITAQYSIKNELITTYPSASAAARAIGKDVGAARNIRSVCLGKRETAYGFKWKYLD